MSKYVVYVYDGGRDGICDGITVPFSRHYECVNELELVEKGIELFKETGGKVGYKRPEKDKGDKFLAHDNNVRIVDTSEGYLTAGWFQGIRLTFTPPEPEPVESEWEKLRGEMRELLTAPDTSVHAKHMLRIMDKIDESEK